VFKIKQGANGEVECYKAKLVARGFTQTYGVDYNETFAPIVKFTSICYILALAALEDMEILRMGIKFMTTTISYVTKHSCVQQCKQHKH
jgi:hypothetical protein